MGRIKKGTIHNFKLGMNHYLVTHFHHRIQSQALFNNIIITLHKQLILICLTI